MTPLSPAHCETGGVGGATFDGLAAVTGTDLFITGTCSVTPGAPTVLAGKYTFVCSTDRDDDGRYTNIDVQSSDPTDRFDDDFVVGSDQ